MTTDREIRDGARELFVADGLTLEEAAERAGVSVHTLKRWSADEGWTDLRREFRETEREIRRDRMLLRKKLIKKALDTLEPQSVYAVAALERAGISGGDAGAGMDFNRREIRTPEDAAAALADAVEAKVNVMLSRPEAFGFKEVKDVKAALELLDEMKRRYGDDADAARRGLTDETVEEIRSKILGIQG